MFSQLSKKKGPFFLGCKWKIGAWKHFLSKNESSIKSKSLSQIAGRDAAWNSIQRTHAVEVGKINSDKKAVDLFRQPNNNTKQEKSGP